MRGTPARLLGGGAGTIPCSHRCEPGAEGLKRTRGDRARRPELQLQSPRRPGAALSAQPGSVPAAGAALRLALVCSAGGFSPAAGGCVRPSTPRRPTLGSCPSRRQRFLLTKRPSSGSSRGEAAGPACPAARGSQGAVPGPLGRPARGTCPSVTACPHPSAEFPWPKQDSAQPAKGREGGSSSLSPCASKRQNNRRILNRRQKSHRLFWKGLAKAEERVSPPTDLQSVAVIKTHRCQDSIKVVSPWDWVRCGAP